MAFSKKTWTDRVSEQPQRRLLTPTGGGTAMTVDVTRQEGIVIQEGDAFSAANMNDLENRIKTALDSDEATINTINNRSITNANNISTLQGNVSTLSTNLAGVTSRVGTLENEFTANGKRLYMDYKNGKYGYNTSANRGADTFFPFNPYSETVLWEKSWAELLNRDFPSQTITLPQSIQNFTYLKFDCYNSVNSYQAEAMPALTYSALCTPATLRLPYTVPFAYILSCFTIEGVVAYKWDGNRLTHVRGFRAPSDTSIWIGATLAVGESGSTTDKWIVPYKITGIKIGQ